MLTTPDKALAKINKIMFATPATALGDEKKTVKYRVSVVG